MTIKLGTSFFPTYSNAVHYYREQEGVLSHTAEITVKHKLREGEIHIGEPPLREGGRLVTIDGGDRYAILRDE